MITKVKILFFGVARASLTFIQLRAEINSSVKLNTKLQDHCLEFQEITFELMISLIREIKKYTNHAKVLYVAISDLPISRIFEEYPSSHI